MSAVIKLSGTDRFLGLAEAELPPCRRAQGPQYKVSVLSYGLERTVSYGPGCSAGPRAILEASKQVELFDHEYSREPFREFELDTDVLSTLGSINTSLHLAESHISRIVGDGRLPLLLGGEHTISVAAVRAIRALYPDLVLVHFDAHLDLRNEYNDESMCHATALRRCVGETSTPLYSFGVRNESLEEYNYRLNKHNISVFSAQKRRRWVLDDFKQHIQGRPIYITVDVDCFDCSLMPATGTPEPGGLFWDDVVLALETTAAHSNIIGADIVELAPINGMPAPDFLAAKLAYKLLALATSPDQRSTQEAPDG